MKTVGLPVLTNSQMRCFRRCNREHYYAYELLMRPLDRSGALRFGSLMHDGGLAPWWSESGTERLEAALAGIAAYCLTGEVDDFDRVRAEELMRGYHYRWVDIPLQTIGVETEFRCDLVNPATGAASRTFALGGKIDALAIDAGRVFKVEHKTSSADIGVGSSYWKCLRMDPQISTYYVGARSLGHDVHGCLYDVIGKPQLRPGTVPLVDEEGVKIVLDAKGERVCTKNGKKYRETADAAAGYVLQTRPETPEEFRVRLREHVAEYPDRYYQRGTVVRLEEEERDAAFDAWQTARQIREAQIANRWPRNPDSCIRFGKECSYFAVCCGEASIEDPTLFRRAERAHEELSPVQPTQSPKEEARSCNL